MVLLWAGFAAGGAVAQTLPSPLTAQDFPSVSQQQAALGHLLFYDKILSGNRNIACSTCHHPSLGSSDGLSLGVGEGGRGLGPKRSTGVERDRIEKRVPRNAPALWNLGARDLHTIMHDGRIARDPIYGNGFNSPAEEWLPQGLESLLAAQAVFPLTSKTEMAGASEENEVSGAVNDRIDKGWPIVAKRVRTIPEYGRRFVAAFDHIDTPEQVTIVEIANALAAFETVEFQSLSSPFDRYLAGDSAALNARQKRGMDLFFGRAACSRCHSGTLLSDQKFHALGLPAFGPGRTRRFDPYARDVGRMGESDDLADAYAFRTPMLRNVALTAPYGHNGAFATLEGILRHHMDPVASNDKWQPKEAALRPAPWLMSIDFVIQSDTREMARQAAVRRPVSPLLAEAEIGDLVAFLHALTGRTEADLPFGVPKHVPSGLPVD